MSHFIRPLLLITVLLLVPVVPFLLLGGYVDEWAAWLREHPPARATTATLVVGLLSTDVFLPVPSSVISTMGGYELGVVFGTLASWLGMCLGAVFGFALARAWGQPLALRFTKPEELRRMKQLSERYGPGVLILVRGVPVLAEASVLLVGVHRMSWRRFLPPVVLSNLGLAIAYSAFGDYAQQHEWLPLALAVSVALPVLLTAAVRRWLIRGEGNDLNDKEAAAGSEVSDSEGKPG